MDDRTLIERAAKACALPECGWMAGTFTYVKDNTFTTWDPLNDDGDALRLAVSTGEPFVVRMGCVTTMGGLNEDFDPAIHGDDLRATRRVIVRAAAALAEQRTGGRE